MSDLHQKSLKRISDFRLKSHVEPGLVRQFNFALGHIDLICYPQDLREIDVQEFEPDYLTLYVEEVADGVMTPVMLEAQIVFNNGVVLKSFTADVDVENVESIVSRDYHEVMHDAIEWVREQFDRPPVPNVIALPQAHRVDTQAA